jgi:hypothetical protein
MADTTTLLEAQADIVIDGGRAQPGRLTIEQEIRRYATASATKPDPSWTLVDERGHFHAYDDDGELPTLNARTRHIDCDGHGEDEPACEGYDITEWTCRICGIQVEPGRRDDSGERTMPGLKSWRAEIISDRPIDNGLVSVRALTADGMHFGTALATIRQAEQQASGGIRVTAELIGASPLGYRRHR